MMSSCQNAITLGNGHTIKHNHNNMLQLYSISVSKILVTEGEGNTRTKCQALF